MNKTVYTQNRLDFGFRIIPQATTFRYDGGVSQVLNFLKISSPYYSRFGFAQGVGILYHPLPRMSLAADLLYSMQGGAYEERKSNLNYLKIPFFIGYNSSLKRKMGFSIQSGIEFSYLTSAKLKYKNGNGSDISSFINKNSISVPFAIGLKFKIGSQYLLGTQLYLSTDINSISKTNRAFGVYNYVLPGLRIVIDKSIKK